MAASEHVVHVGHREGHGLNGPGNERLGLLQAPAELAAERFAPHELLVPRKRHGRRAHVSIAVRCALGRRDAAVRRIDVDQLHDPVGVGPSCRNEQLRRDRPGHREVLLERLRQVHEHVRPRRGEPLVGDHVLLGHRLGRVANPRHRFRRIAHVGIARVHIVRRLERQPASFPEIEDPPLRLGGRPR